MNIVCNPAVILYKRQHAQSLGEANSAAQNGDFKPNSRKLLKILKILIGFLREPIPIQYLSKCNGLEGALILLLYPIAVVRVVSTAFSWRNDKLRRFVGDVKSLSRSL